MKAKQYSKTELQALTDSGKTLKQIAVQFGVTKQRIYQIFQSLGIATPEKRRKNMWQDLTEQQKWFWRTANSKGFSKLLKMELMNSLVFPDNCPVLGIPLEYNSIGKGIADHNSPSLDRICCKEPYTPDNIFIISWRANALRKDGSWEEHQKIAEYFKKLET